MFEALFDFLKYLAEIERMLKKAGFRIDQVEKRGGYYEMIGTILLYIFKWVFRSEIPFKKLFNQKKDEEFLNEKDGFVTIFVKATRL